MLVRDRNSICGRTLSILSHAEATVTNVGSIHRPPRRLRRRAILFNFDRLQTGRRRRILSPARTRCADGPAEPSQHARLASALLTRDAVRRSLRILLFMICSKRNATSHSPSRICPPESSCVRTSRGTPDARARCRVGPRRVGILRCDVLDIGAQPRRAICRGRGNAQGANRQVGFLGWGDSGPPPLPRQTVATIKTG